LSAAAFVIAMPLVVSDPWAVGGLATPGTQRVNDRVVAARRGLRTLHDKTASNHLASLVHLLTGVAGYLVGLSVTLRDGHLPDIAFHVTVSPVLVWTLVKVSVQVAAENAN
jgi:hypothetical protein